MLHNETRNLLIQAYNKTHNAKEVAECFSVDVSTVYRLVEQMKREGSADCHFRIQPLPDDAGNADYFSCI